MSHRRSLLARIGLCRVQGRHQAAHDHVGMRTATRLHPIRDPLLVKGELHARIG